MAISKLFTIFAAKTIIMSNENNTSRAGCFALGISFLFPIIGIILYFVYRDRVTNARAYLISALLGFLLSLILSILLSLAPA